MAAPTWRSPRAAPASPSASMTAPASIAVSDLDRDGKLDLEVGYAGAGVLSVFRGHGDGSFADEVDYGSGALLIGIASGDLDGDGAPDVAGVGDFGQMVVFWNDG